MEKPLDKDKIRMIAHNTMLKLDVENMLEEATSVIGRTVQSIGNSMAKGGFEGEMLTDVLQNALNFYLSTARVHILIEALKAKSTRDEMFLFVAAIMKDREIYHRKMIETIKQLAEVDEQQLKNLQ